MESAIASKEENLQKLMVIMRPSESGVVPDGCVTSYEVQCLTLIAGSESIQSNVHNMRSMGLHYIEQKKNFIELRLN